ncbi:hypothetical protein [Alkalihalobacterium alkalinitrilicum]|uniref:hypothetical protein n=1 Tax=Alkalihalobacterium alkalinitrilicum TaxID=427920 RepID=UPI000994E4A3|nr:hypothetical protein [Alkalihalobacterium alkalinitrilicum]
MKRLQFSSLLIVCFIIMTACSSENIEKITIYEMENFSAVKEETATDFNMKEEIEVFQKAFNSAVKQSGIVNMADPNYKVNLGEKSYFIWISEGSGTIMNTKDTHTIYSLTNKSAEEVYELIVNRYVN